MLALEQSESLYQLLYVYIDLQPVAKTYKGMVLFAHKCWEARLGPGWLQLIVIG